MASQRFRKLERGKGSGAAHDAAAGSLASPEPIPTPEPISTPDASARARNLERDGELRLDEAPPETDFCRYCRFENRAGMGRCMNCGSPLGGPEQEPFDEQMRARREAKRETAAPAVSRDAGEATQAAQHAIGSLDVGELLRASERDEPGFGTVIASGVLVACIFALLSIPVRRIFGGAGGALELILLVGFTLAVYASVRRRLLKL